MQDLEFEKGVGVEFKDRLKQLRIVNHLKQSEFAVMLNVSPQGVSAYENGREPDYQTLIKIAEVFNCTTDYLLGLSDVRTYNETEKDKRIVDLEFKCERQNRLIKTASKVLESMSEGLEEFE